MSLTVYRRGNLRQIVGLPLAAGPSFTIATEPFRVQFSAPQEGDEITDAAGDKWVVSEVGDLDTETNTWAVTCEAPEPPEGP